MELFEIDNISHIARTRQLWKMYTWTKDDKGLYSLYKLGKG